MAQKIFIDGGGNKSQSSRYALDKFPERIIHVFEPLPDYEKYFKDLDVIYHPQAIWIEDGFIELYPAKYTEGSTVIKGKLTAYVDYQNPIKVPCLNFSKWLRENFAEEDDIIVKLNIEGAEIEVLKKLLVDGTIKLIDKLFVQFHAKKINTIFLKDQKKLIENLEKAKVDFSFWKIPYNQSYYPYDT